MDPNIEATENSFALRIDVTLPKSVKSLPIPEMTALPGQPTTVVQLSPMLQRKDEVIDRKRAVLYKLGLEFDDGQLTGKGAQCKLFLAG